MKEVVGGGEKEIAVVAATEGAAAGVELGNGLSGGGSERGSEGGGEASGVVSQQAAEAEEVYVAVTHNAYSECHSGRQSGLVPASRCTARGLCIRTPHSTTKPRARPVAAHYTRLVVR